MMDLELVVVVEFVNDILGWFLSGFWISCMLIIPSLWYD